MFLLSGPSKHGWWHWYWHRWEQHSWFPPQQPSGNFSSSFLFIIFYWWIKVNHCFNTLWQFQAFRAMVQANPQILQVISLSVTPPPFFWFIWKQDIAAFSPCCKNWEGRTRSWCGWSRSIRRISSVWSMNLLREERGALSLSLSPLST